MDVVQRIANFHGDTRRALRRKLPFLREDPAKEVVFHPLHHNAGLVHVAAVKHAHNARVIQLFSDKHFTLKPAVKYGIALEFGMGNFQRNKLIRFQVCRPVNRGHAGAQHESFDPEVLKVLAWLKLLR
jgi:hypothetical protein